MSALTACQVVGNNHSADTVTVYQGAPSPILLCGYHNGRRMFGEAVRIERASAVREGRPLEPVAWRCDCVTVCNCEALIPYALVEEEK